MPTIDQLAPATAAADTDQLLVSQGGVARKISRSQVLAGVQSQLAIQGGTLLGRSTSGAGAPEAITIGQNLVLQAGTLTATSTPFVVGLLANGVVPSSSDMVVMAQSGTNVAVPYRQFMSGLPTVSGIDGSQMLVTPAGSTKAAVKLADLAATALLVTGGTMSGALTLSSDPTAQSQASTKGYVDGQVAGALSKSGGTLSGPLTLSGDPTVSMQAASKGYVDNQATLSLPKAGGTLSGAMMLSSDPSLPLHAATKQYVDQRVSRSGDTLTGLLTLSADPSNALHAATKGYVDSQTISALQRTGGSLSGALTLAGDPSTALQAATRQYVDSRLLRSGDTMSGALVLSADPTTGNQAATKNYVDMQNATHLLKTGGTLSGVLTLASDPTVALQASTKQYVDTRVARSGDTLTGALTLAADPTFAMQATTKSYVDGQVATALSRAGGTLTGALALAADPSAPTQAATKRYVDVQVTNLLPLTGGTLAGALTLSAAPTVAQQAANKQYVDSQIVTLLPTTGGTLTGPITMAADPVLPMQATTKQYVDANPGPSGVINVKMAPYNAKLDGVTDDTAAFKAAYLATPANGVIFVPRGVAVLQTCSSWGVSTTKRVKWVVNGTTLADGTSLASSIPTGGYPSSVVLPGITVGNTAAGAEIAAGGSQQSDFAVLHTSYIVNHNGGAAGSVVAYNRSDTIIYNSPNNYVWGGLDRLIWVGVQTPTASSPAQHVARYMQTIRQSIATDSSGQPLPQPQMWASCMEYRDTTGKSSSWANDSLVIEMDWIGNGADDGNKRQIQSLVVAQHDQSGAPVEVSSVIGVYLGGGSSGKAFKVFNIAIPFSTAVLDTTQSQQLSGAAAIRMAAGHAIAFEPSCSNRLAYDSATGTLRWNQGSLSYVVGKGISVGWQNVAAGNTALPAYLAGNIVFLIGSGSYSIFLPAANSVPAGTGFTFSALGSGNVSIVPATGDGIDQGPIVLRQNDRYHVVSDGSSYWREIFRVNAISPRYSGPVILPNYTVASLPASPGAGAKAFATNGRKPSESANAGSGVEVFHDGQRWISVCSGTQVAA